MCVYVCVCRVWTCRRPISALEPDFTESLHSLLYSTIWHNIGFVYTGLYVSLLTNLIHNDMPISDGAVFMFFEWIEILTVWRSNQNWLLEQRLPNHWTRSVRAPPTPWELCTKETGSLRSHCCLRQGNMNQRPNPRWIWDSVSMINSLWEQVW